MVQRFAMNSQEQLVELGQKYLYPNYRQPPLVLSRGQGCEVWDKNGRRYLDFTAGIAVNSLGHAHPVLVRAIATQAALLCHTSNYFFNEPNVLLAEKLCGATHMARAFFCNSGTEAIEACLKLARRHFFDSGAPERVRVIAFEKSFHGRTLGALAATGQAAYRDGFGPLGPVSHVPYGSLEAVNGVFDQDVAAIIVEPIQGEGGVVPGSPEFLRGLRQSCDDQGVLLIADEIQTGVGRTGRFLALEHAGVRADVVALAKGLGGGFPIGAMVCTAALATALPPGSHGTTFGGNPLASAAALAVLETLETEGLVAHAGQLGRHLAGLLKALKDQRPDVINDVRGMGLLQAIELDSALDARGIVGKLRDRGLLVTVAGGQSLRLSPPLIATEADCAEALQIIDDVLSPKSTGDLS